MAAVNHCSAKLKEHATHETIHSDAFGDRTIFGNKCFGVFDHIHQLLLMHKGEWSTRILFEDCYAGLLRHNWTIPLQLFINKRLQLNTKYPG
jgi:hypothetical protein